MAPDVCNFEILRELRKNEGLSIAELSERSGVSASVISKLERNVTTAEIDTLHRIARVFGITLSDLVALAENRTSHVVAQTVYQSDDFKFTRVEYGNLGCMRAAPRRGARLSRREAHRDDYELCWVTQGKLAVTVGSERHELAAGNAIQFDAVLPHCYEVLEDAILFIVHIRKGKRF